MDRSDELTSDLGAERSGGDSPSAVAVLIVTWNSRELIAECVEHVRRNTEVPYTLWVYDNASRDGTGEWLRERIPAERLVLSPANRGWVGAINHFLELAPAAVELVFPLNPDALVQPGWLGPLQRALASDARAAFASPTFTYPDQRVQYQGVWLTRTWGLDVRDHGKPFVPEVRDGAVPVGFAHGQCLMRLSVLRRLGGLDPSFGLGYFEEFDVQCRAYRLGFHPLRVPGSLIVHATARSFAKAPSGTKDALLTRNWLLFMLIHYPAAALLLRLPWELLRPARGLLSAESVGPRLRGILAFLRDAPAALAKRRRAARLGSVPWRRLRRPGGDP